MRQRIQQFMIGRYGPDQLSNVLLGFSVFLLIITLFSKWQLLNIVAVAILLLAYYRMFSKDVSKRYAENQKFLVFRSKFLSKWQIKKQHFMQLKTHHFYKCPNCKQKIRVPKGKGKICITCPKCKNEFIKNS